MNNNIVYALYDDDDILLTSVKKMKEKNLNVKEVYTPFPVHGLDKVLELKETRMAITAFIYGCIGLTFGSVLIYYIMISGEYKSWPMNIGGKPNFTFFKNLTSFVPVLFELTLMFSGHLMSLTYFYRCKLFPGSQETSPDPRTTDDKFLVEIEHENFKEVEKFLKTTGAIEIKKKDDK